MSMIGLRYHQIDEVMISNFQMIPLPLLPPARSDQEELVLIYWSPVSEQSDNLKIRFFSSCHERGIKTNSECPWGIEPRTFGFCAPMPLSRRDTTASEVEVHMTRVLHTAGISNVDSVVFVDRKIRERVGFELGREIKKDVFRFVTSVGQRKFWVPMSNATPSHVTVMTVRCSVTCHVKHSTRLHRKARRTTWTAELRVCLKSDAKFSTDIWFADPLGSNC